MKEIEQKLADHDHSIDVLAHAVEDLASTAGITNVKLDKVVDAINNQNVLIERMNNLDSNLKESFNRVHEKIRYLESCKNGAGCETAKRLETEKHGFEDKIKVANNRLDDIESSITWIVRLIIGGLLSGVIGTLFILARG